MYGNTPTSHSGIPFPVSFLDQPDPRFGARHQSFPEFLRKLVDILSNSANSSIIEWMNSKIYIYDPNGLCEEILPKYFRHSNFTSFTRQLNYFGFKKKEGKGRKNPCVYGCDELDGKGIDAILSMKRKTNNSKREGLDNSDQQPPSLKLCLENPAEILQTQSLGAQTTHVLDPSWTENIAETFTQPNKASLSSQVPVIKGAHVSPRKRREIMKPSVLSPEENQRGCLTPVITSTAEFISQFHITTPPQQSINSSGIFFKDEMTPVFNIPSHLTSPIRVANKSISGSFFKQEENQTPVSSPITTTVCPTPIPATSDVNSLFSITPSNPSQSHQPPWISDKDEGNQSFLDPEDIHMLLNLT